MKHCARLICLFTAFVVAGSSLPVDAQSRRAKQKQQNERPRIQPVTVVNNPSPQYLSGEVSVTVRGNENPIIRLGLAQNGVALVEFPANDRFFAINPGNPELITIEDSPTKETDRFFVMRPGTGFVPAPDGSKAPSPAASVVVQMNSGMVVTFLLYPVSDIERNAHRCVVMYDRDAIINARKSAGLATNLARREESAVGKQPATSIRMTTPSDSAQPLQSMPTNPQTPASPSPPQNTPSNSSTEQTTKAPASASGNTSGERASPENAGNDSWFPTGKEKWSKSHHGLKVAVQTRTVGAKHRQVAVSVRNTLSVPVRIVPGHPELQIQTLDEKGRVLQFEPVARLKVACSIADGMIAPGKTARYLITYETPVLGAKQRLGVAVAQTNAADEPVTVELSSGTR
jgi:hypothetical protein